MRSSERFKASTASKGLTASRAASVQKLFTVFTAPTQLGQTIAIILLMGLMPWSIYATGSKIHTYYNDTPPILSITSCRYSI